MERTLRTVVPILAILLVGYVVLRVFFGGTAETPPAFQEALTFEQASARAAENDQPVLVFATADWCGPCQHFKRNALAERRVTDAIRERTEPVYLDLTDAQQNPDSPNAKVAQQLGVGPIPALILMRNGEEVARNEGALSTVELLTWLEAH